MTLDPALADSLCGYCRLGESGACPVYPMIGLNFCEEFRAHPATAHDAAVLVAAHTKDSERHWRLLCDIIQGKR